MENYLRTLPEEPSYDVHAQDWTLLLQSHVQIRLAQNAIACGQVDAVTDNGDILWLRQEGAHTRRLFEREEGYEAWVASAHTPLVYQVASQDAHLVPSIQEPLPKYLKLMTS